MSEDDLKHRRDFLFKMYDQMFSDINRHIMVVWQSLGVLLGALALLSLIEKRIISLDLATTLVVVIATWSTIHSLEAGYWYNRNLVIIANIERQFLVESDLREIHYYFGKHRRDNKLLDQLKFQIGLAGAVALLFLFLHFAERILPLFQNTSLQLTVFAPYFTVGVSLALIFYISRRLNRKYAEFLENSPGRPINTAGIVYGVGHPGITNSAAQSHRTPGAPS